MFWVVPILGATYLSSPSISHVNWGAFWFALTQMMMTHPLTLPVLAVVALRLAQGRGVSPRLRGWIYAAAIWSLIVLGIGLGG